MVIPLPTDLPALTIIIANPHGFCAGVQRAIDIVERALEIHGAPIYVRHEIVHNKYVVEDLRQRGVVFVDNVDDIPDSHHQRPVIFSAHGVPQSVLDHAKENSINHIDATCPLVTKVHMAARHHAKRGYHQILIGHEGHPEIIGTMGQVPDGAITLIGTPENAATVTPPADQPLAYLTQTTLSVEETAQIIRVLRRRFPHIKGPTREDICYATTNRQEAVKNVAPLCDAFWVIGSENSSNTARLVEVAQSFDIPAQRVENTPIWDSLKEGMVLGISSGASAPEVLVDAMLDAIKQRFQVTVRSHETCDEKVSFKLPRALSAP